MIKVEINKQVKSRVPQKLISQAAKEIQNLLKIKKNLVVSLAVVSDKTIKMLNQRYRGRNKITDVLSFEESDMVADPEFIGEILICYPQLKKQAREKIHSAQQEFLILFIHGLLHLLGYDHQAAKLAKKMEELEAKILRSIYQ